MDQRSSARVQSVAEVEVAIAGRPAFRGSLTDLSGAGCCVRYLPKAFFERAAEGDEVSIDGVLPTGAFVLRGTISRLNGALGEIGATVDAEAVAAVRRLVHSPIAGTSGTPGRD